MKTETFVLCVAMLGAGLIQDAFGFYNPSHGRWLSRDPIAEEGGIAIYAHNVNDSINKIDPLGRDFIAVGTRPVRNTMGIVGHMSLEFHRGGPCVREGETFTAATRPGLRTDAVELLGRDHCYRHFFWVQPRPYEPPEQHFDWDLISEVTYSSSAERFVVIYADVAGQNAAARWNDIRIASNSYGYAEHPLGTSLFFWPNSKYELPPGNNSNTFIREMARRIGRDANVIGGWHPGAESPRQVSNPGYTPEFSPWSDCVVAAP